MPPKHDLVNGVTCAEGISLLYLLHSVPTLPSRNSLTSHNLHEHGYILSLSEELRLVEALAFLANIDHDVNRIPAICIQQVTGTSLNVLVAVNQSKWGDGSQYLDRLRKGFESIFVLLDRSKHSFQRYEAQEQILSTIIFMCSSRILHRMRLVAGRGLKPKQPIQAVLRIAIDSLKQSGRPILGHYFALSITFTEKAKEAIKTADAWTKHQTMPRLQDLVTAIHSLKHTGDVEAMLKTLPNQTMDPTMRRNVYNILNKVSRYRDISRCLLRMSNKHELLRNLKLVTVKLPQSAWSRSEEDNHIRTLTSVFSQLELPSQKRGLVQLFRTLNITGEESNERFVAQTRKTLSEAKIHAEIQIVYYCELNPCKLPPRIIASSKDACYLCNAFISMHGKMHTSRTHGRLYPGWRLPMLPELLQLEQRFNAVLAAQIRASIAMLVAKGCKTVYPEPNESTLLSMIHSESTILNAPSELADRSESVIQPPSVCGPLSQQTSRSRYGQEECSNASRDVASEDVCSYVNHAVEPIPTNTRIQQDSSPHIENYDEKMVVGRKIIVQHNKTLNAGESLELHVELPSMLLSATGSHRAVEYSFTWMTTQNVDRGTTHSSSSIVDLEALQQETTFEFDDEGQLLIGNHSVVVKISRCTE